MNMNDSMPTEFDYDWDRLAGLYPTDFIEKMKGLDGKARKFQQKVLNRKL